MVATRQSLPADPATAAQDASASPEPSDGMSKKAAAALKKLYIDGKDTLKGERPEQQVYKTYHYRGAAYAVDDGTKPEWVEEQPMRYLKRKRAEGNDIEGDGQQNGSGGRSEEAVGDEEAGSSAKHIRFDGGSGVASKQKAKRKRSSTEGAAEEDEGTRRRKIAKLQSTAARKSALNSPPTFTARRDPSTSKIIAETQAKLNDASTNDSTTTHLPSPPSTTTKDTRNTISANEMSSRNNNAASSSSANPSTTTPRPSQWPAFDALPEADRLAIVRETKANLWRLAQANTQHERLTCEYRKLLLRRRLRELALARDDAVVRAEGGGGVGGRRGAVVGWMGGEGEREGDVGLPTTTTTTTRAGGEGAAFHRGDPGRAESALPAPLRSAGAGDGVSGVVGRAETREERRRRAERELAMIRGWAEVREVNEDGEGDPGVVGAAAAAEGVVGDEEVGGEVGGDAAPGAKTVKGKDSMEPEVQHRPQPMLGAEAAVGEALAAVWGVCGRLPEGEREGFLREVTRRMVLRR